jgi:hypothetical protein
MRRVVVAVSVSVLILLAVVASAVSAPKPPKTGQLTIAAKPNPITFGQTTTISGKLKGAKAGVVVTLQQNRAPYTGGYKNVATTTTAQNGDYSFAGQRPTVSSRYRTTSQTPATSSELLVPVRISVSLRVSDTTPRSGQRVRFFGSARPQHDGKRVRIQRQTATGWKTVARVRLRDAGSERSRYSRRLQVRRDAAYRARVYRDADHATGTSTTKSLDAH